MNEDEIYQKGFEYRCSGQYAEAKVEFQKLLGINPRHVKARMQIGLIQGFEGDFDTSMATLAALSTEVPGFPRYSSFSVSTSTSSFGSTSSTFSSTSSVSRSS